MSASDEFRSRWKNEERPDVFHFIVGLGAGVPADQVAEIVLVDLEEGWQRGCGRPVQDYLKKFPAISTDQRLKLRIIESDYRQQLLHAAAPELDSYLMQFPDLQDDLRIRLSALDTTDQLPGEVNTFHESRFEYPSRRVPRRPPDSMPSVGPDHSAGALEQIGRYPVTRVIASGSFGTVYEAFDKELARQVAIKVPKVGTGSVDDFRTEARHLAQLKHPHIVSVHDFGVTKTGMCYVVAEFVPGDTLAAAMKRPFATEEAVGLIAKVADALHYAHRRQIVHRDIKPANILLDEQRSPCVADFGLALNEEQQQYLAGCGAGTPAYMSPEQVRGESESLDGRSDIFSLGIILYELLTGQRPFRGKTLRDMAAAIQRQPAKPLRVVNPDVQLELERICLKCLEKDLSNRYLTADDLAADLRQWLAGGVQSDGRTAGRPAQQLSVVTVLDVDESPYPVRGCVLMNRHPEPQVVTDLSIDVLDFCPLRSGAASRELQPVSRVDVVLPASTGTVHVPLDKPVFLLANDAVMIEVGLSCRDAGQNPCSPALLGGFRYRLHFSTDLGQKASTHELTLGRI